MPDERAPWDQTCIEPLGAADRLAHVRHCSPFAAGLVDRHPRWLEQLQAAGRLDSASPPHLMRASEWVASHGLNDGLRGFRNQEMLRIVWRDLCGLAPLGEVLTDLSTLAEICLAQAMDGHHGECSQRHGTPRDDHGNPQSPVVIGLGKLGGSELNLSSDIDIVFCYPESGKCDGPRGLSNEEYFARLARAVIATLADVRPSGFCFRVDTRLRPFGNAGPVVCSFAAMEQYYQREGRDWERYALVKARPVAGDINAGNELIDALRPFVYRRYIDFGAIEALRDMQALIRAEAAREDREDDIKRGPGGIREIEFLAQGFQLLRGGREPRLQTPRLAEALNAISDLGLLPENEVDRLRDDYAVLRHVENRVQAMRDQQTHRIPDGEDLDRLARGMGAESGAALRERISGVRRHVSDIFDETWADQATAPESANDADPLAPWQRLWAQWRDGDAAPDDGPLAPLGNFLKRLPRRPTGQRAAKRLDRFMPRLLQRLDTRRPKPEAVTRLLDLILVITQRSAYLALLAESPAALDRTIELFSRSAWVAKRVARFPALLDELIDPALGHHIPDRAALTDAVARRLELREEESILAGLNYLKQATCLRLAVAWLERRIDGSALQESLSGLAEVMLQATLQLARRQLRQRHGVIRGSQVTVIGYGSLGARELAFGSDLDLVFLYRKGEGESDGERPLPAERWHARLAQRMVALLTALTPSGKLYDTDTRLRPNGQSGLLVSNIDAFEAYQRESAWTWEAQALTRARATAGDAALGEEFEAVRQACLCRERDAGTVGRELLEMRERIRKTHGAGSTAALAIKHGPGGLVDIGFIAQLGVLTLASDVPAVARPAGAAQQLEGLREARWLNEAQARMLLTRLAHLRRLRFALELDADDPDQPDHRALEEGDVVARLLADLAGSVK